ncbi:hypothetical protein B0E50_01730 [Rhodanobacter sp. C01]|nr:hypothetical protein B0E50_01730 [Rhodanobacter sp. C01]
MRQLVKLQSHSWRQSGSIMLWRYVENRRNFPGWNFTANVEGCASLIALLDAFTKDDIPVSRTLTITAPTPAALANVNNRSAASVAPVKLRMSFSAVLSKWAFSESIDPAEFSIGAEWLPLFRQAIADIHAGKDDYSIGPSGSSMLWVWRQPAA